MTRQLVQLRRYRFLLLFPIIYALVCKIVNTLLFTIVSSLVLVKGKVGLDFSNTVNEVAGQYIFLAYAVGAAFVTITLWLGDRALYQHQVFWNDNHRSFWQLERRAKEEFLRGLSSGLSVAFIYILVFAIAGAIIYLGTYITSAIGTPVFPLFFMDLLSLIVFIFCEEFLFRHKLLRKIHERMSPMRAVLLTSGIYIALKYVQFQLVPLDYINLLLLNITLGFFYLKSGRAHRGLGFLSALYGALHSFAGLPLWTHSSPSFFLFKENTKMISSLSGGSAGPLSSLGLTSILLVFAIGAYISWKKSNS
jgi:membrane protease YdiL (CAAX protease family)